MTKNLFIIPIFLFIFLSCQEDSKNSYAEYYRTYNQVIQLYKGGEYQKAFETFQKAEQLVEFIPVEHLLKARELAINIENCNYALEYFQKAVNNGFEYNQFEFSSDICEEISNSSITAIEFDLQYQNEVKSIYQIDQETRGNADYKNLKKMDSININKLLSLIEEKGYPSSKKIGREAADNAFIILLHFDSDIDNKILKPIIDEAYQNGMIQPRDYAWIIDRRLSWGPEKLEPYYYQLPSEKYFELTNEEITEIEKRRKSIGLPELSEMNITKTEGGGFSTSYSF